MGVRAQTVATHEAPPTWSAATTSPTATSPRSRASWMLTAARLAHRTGRSVSRAASICRRPWGLRSSGWITVRRLGRPCSAATRSTASPSWRATTPITVRPRARSTPQLHVPSAAQPTSAGIRPSMSSTRVAGGDAPSGVTDITRTWVFPRSTTTWTSSVRCTSILPEHFPAFPIWPPGPPLSWPTMWGGRHPPSP